jgi:hypothetical protein
MAYTVPNFNLSIDLWVPGNTPSAGAADVSPELAQLYMHSRADIDNDASKLGSYWPNVVWRWRTKMQLAYALPWKGGIIGYKDANTDWWYYLIDFWEHCHAEFPNAYILVNTRQCNDDGTIPDGGR